MKLCENATKLCYSQLFCSPYQDAIATNWNYYNKYLSERRWLFLWKETVQMTSKYFLRSFLICVPKITEPSESLWTEHYIFYDRSWKLLLMTFTAKNYFLFKVRMGTMTIVMPVLFHTYAVFIRYCARVSIWRHG